MVSIRFTIHQASVAPIGDWVFAAATTLSGKRAIGVAASAVKQTIPNAVGTKAISTTTPVATTEHGLREICTREPACPLHTISLDEALKNGKPTVVVFATPLLCESQLCGPVTDEVILASQKFGKQANFIHVEEFLPGPDLKPDASKLSPGFTAWGFTTEPWVIVIDDKGVIRARLQGPTVEPMIDAAMQPVL